MTTRQRGLGTFGVIVVIAGTFFGTRWHYATQAAVAVAELSQVADSLGGVISQRDEQLSASSIRLDSVARTAALSLSQAETTPTPSRPPEPVRADPTAFWPKTVIPVLEMEAREVEWGEYADSIETKLELETAARAAVEAERDELRRQNMLLFGQLQDGRVRYEAESEVSLNLAKQVAALKTPQWFKMGKVKFIGGLALGAIACGLFC